MAAKQKALWSADPRTVLRAGAGFDLAEFDRRSTPGWNGSKKDAAAFADSRGALLAELQERLFAEGRAGGKRSVLVVTQGIDSAGKGGVSRHVLSYVDPQGVAMRSFGVPTEEERAHHYLWRIEKALPRPGLIGVFDRSHYEDVLVVRVENLVEPEVWEKRYDEINEWEARLVEEGTTIIKVAMMIDRDEQGVRLMERLDRPDKRWKYSPGDVDTRLKWDAYQEAYQAVFDRTSTDVAPWYVIPADRRWYARLAIIELLTQTLIDLEPAWPARDFDVTTERERLAATMSDSALRASADETQAKVISALQAHNQVTRDMIKANKVSGASKKETAAAKRLLQDEEASNLRELQETMAQKQAILADRSKAAKARKAAAKKPAKQTARTKTDEKAGGKTGEKTAEKTPAPAKAAVKEASTAPAKKAPAKKTPPEKAPTKKAPVRSATTATKTAKTPAAKAAAKTTTKATTKTPPAKKTETKTSASTSRAAKTPARTTGTTRGTTRRTTSRKNSAS